MPRRWAIAAVLLSAVLGAGSVLAACAPPPPPNTHVVIVVEENRAIGQILGAPAAPFLNRLAGSGTVLSSYYAVSHPSLPDYLAMTAGQTAGISTDCTGCSAPVSNLAGQLTHAGVSWKAYMEDLPAPCSPVAASGGYVKRHNPFAYFPDLRATGACRNIVPLTELGRDLAADRLPQFAFVIPNVAHDMHDGSVATADQWLGRLYGGFAASPAWRHDVRFVVTFDESVTADRSGCCAPGIAGGHVLTVVSGPRVRHSVDPASYSHYSLLRSVESLFGLPPLAHAADPGTRTIPAIATR